MIELERVTMRYPVPKRYRDYLIRPFERRYSTALREISIAISEGECVGLLGANGAGKTTLLKIIGGLLYPSSGVARIDGCDTRMENQKVRQKVGFIINEERSFYWRLTGAQNLDFFGTLDNLSGKKRRKRIEEMLYLVGLQDVSSTLVSSYSCGMRQRLAIARGMLADPDVLILDEPTKSLDPLGAEELRCLITQDIHNGCNKTLIIATHNVQEAKEICGRICIIKQGSLLACCPLEHALSYAGGVEGYYKTAVTEAESIAC